MQLDGSLFYIDYDYQQPIIASTSTKPQITQESTSNLSKFNRSSTRRSKKTGSKLSKLMNRNLKPISKTKLPVKPVLSNSDSTKVKFSEIAQGELKSLLIEIDPAMRHKYGRRASVSEAILGVSICSFPGDGNKRIMIAGYMPNSILGQDKLVKVGDWLKCINEEEVNVENIDLVLLAFTEPIEIKLTLQRMSGEEPGMHQQLMYNKIRNVQELIENAGNIFATGTTDNIALNSEEMIFGVLYLTMNNLDENGPEGQDVLFCYPPKEKNCKFILHLLARFTSTVY